MDALEIVSIVLAGAWLAAALASLLRQTDYRRTATLACAAPAVTQLLALWRPLAPLVIAAWLGYALSLPDGRLVSGRRRAVVGAAALAATGTSVAFIAADKDPSRPIFFSLAAGAAVVGVLGGAVRYRRIRHGRATMQWVAAASVLTSAYLIVCAVL